MILLTVGRSAPSVESQNVLRRVLGGRKMATRTWIGGGNNEANNPNDWSPTGLPIPGETLTATHGIIKIQGNELTGPGTLGSSVLQLQGDVSVNLSKEANVMPISVLQGVADINIKDNAQFMLSTNGGSAVVDLANKSEWIGNFSAFTGSIVINGDHHAEFITNSSPSGATEVSNGAPAHVIINADIGQGSSEIDATAGATVEVGGSVASGQIFQANAFSSEFGPALSTPGILKIDYPDLFAGIVNLGIGEIDLIGLRQADSYSYINDMLSFYSHGSIIDKLAVHQVPSISGSILGALAVEKTSFGIAVYTSGEAHSAGTLLPLHA
jgi:hypothetical protein